MTHPDQGTLARASGLIACAAAEVVVDLVLQLTEEATAFGMGILLKLPKTPGRSQLVDAKLSDLEVLYETRETAWSFR